MNLWVRSQDKKKLIKVNEIKIESVIDGNSFIYSDITDLGTYKTKERALEVLDEIQNILKPRIMATIKPSEEMKELMGGRQFGKIKKMKQDMEIKELSTYVYEMPKE
jgi:hypothetical protein